MIVGIKCTRHETHLCVQIFIHGAFCRRFIYSTLVLCVVCVICIIIRCCYVGMIYFDALVCVRVRQTRRLRNLLLHFMYLHIRKILQNDKLWFKFYEWKVAVCCTVICVVYTRVYQLRCVYVYQHTLIDTHTQSRSQQRVSKTYIIMKDLPIYIRETSLSSSFDRQ